MDADTVPLIYPYLTKKKGLKQFLISKRIYNTTYWSGVPARVNPGDFEHRLATELVSLPIDQRYDTDDMRLIADTVLNY